MFYAKVIAKSRIKMTSPVNNQRPLPVPAAQPVQQVAPGGVGDQPTTIDAAAAPEESYIKTALSKIKDFFVWIYNKVASWFQKEEITPVGSPPEFDLIESLQREVKFIKAFEKLEPQAKNRICEILGREIYTRWHLNHWRCSYESLGLAQIQANPLVLERFLVPRQAH